MDLLSLLGYVVVFGFVGAIALVLAAIAFYILSDH